MSFSKQDNAKEPWLVLNLSLLLPGLGQIYAGRINKGVCVLGVYLFLLISNLSLIYDSEDNFKINLILAVLTGILWFWSILDSYLSTRSANSIEFEQERRKNKDPWLAVFLSYIFPGVGHLYLRKWLWGIAILLVFAFLPHTIEVLFTPLILYVAYQMAPVKREQSNKQIFLFSAYVIIIFLFSLGAVFLIKTNLLQAFKIPAGSMRMTLLENDRILVKKSAQFIPNRGDVIVFIYPEDRKRDFVKRVIGLPGEAVEIKDGKILINDNPLNDPKISQRYYYNNGTYGGVGQKITVPSDAYFVLGDNSSSSKDSRYWGFVPKQDIIGKAFKIYWPLARVGMVE